MNKELKKTYVDEEDWGVISTYEEGKLLLHSREVGDIKGLIDLTGVDWGALQSIEGFEYSKVGKENEVEFEHEEILDCPYNDTLESKLLGKSKVFLRLDSKGEVKLGGFKFDDVVNSNKSNLGKSCKFNIGSNCGEAVTELVGGVVIDSV